MTGNEAKPSHIIGCDWHRKLTGVFFRVNHTLSCKVVLTVTILMNGWLQMMSTQSESVESSAGSLKRKATSPPKELEVVTADDLGVATVEVIGADDTNKSSRMKVGSFNGFYIILADLPLNADHAV